MNIKAIALKHAPEILGVLLTGKKRFGELERAINGISPRTLSLRVDHFEEIGLVTREAFAEVPPRVEYALTTKGKAVAKILQQIVKV